MDVKLQKLSVLSTFSHDNLCVSMNIKGSSEIWSDGY